MAEIPLGRRHVRTILVTSEVAIDFLGVEQARVLATPHLVWQLEMACRECIKPLLEDGYDSVGTDVQIKHLAATPLGMSVTFRAEVIHVDGNRVRFRVEASDEKERISEGTHERYVVNVARFASRVAAKAEER
jgi:predicted thioesterase